MKKKKEQEEEQMKTRSNNLLQLLLNLSKRLENLKYSSAVDIFHLATIYSR